MGCTQSTANKPAVYTPPSFKERETDFSPPYPVIGSNAIMCRKKNGTSLTPVQSNLRWNCSTNLANRICNHNRHFAENYGYFETRKEFMKELQSASKKKPLQFYDSNTGNLLFTAPQERSLQSFLLESKSHGWPSFRDAEVNWRHVRCLKNGECVSLDGTHLGHNLPDERGNRYCINLVSVAGRPIERKGNNVAEEQSKIQEDTDKTDE